MDAVGEVQFQGRLASCLVGFHFIDIGRTESGAGILVFLSAYSVADVKVWNPQMGWLLFLVCSPRVVYIRFLIKGLGAVELDEPFLFVGRRISAVEISYLFGMDIIGFGAEPAFEDPAAQDILKTRFCET